MSHSQYIQNLSGVWVQEHRINMNQQSLDIVIVNNSSGKILNIWRGGELLTAKLCHNIRTFIAVGPHWFWGIEESLSTLTHALCTYWVMQIHRDTFITCYTITTICYKTQDKCIWESVRLPFSMVINDHIPHIPTGQWQAFMTWSTNYWYCRKPNRAV